MTRVYFHIHIYLRHYTFGNLINQCVSIASKYDCKQTQCSRQKINRKKYIIRLQKQSLCSKYNEKPAKFVSAHATQAHRHQCDIGKGLLVVSLRNHNFFEYQFYTNSYLRKLQWNLQETCFMVPHFFDIMNLNTHAELVLPTFLRSKHLQARTDMK